MTTSKSQDQLPQLPIDDELEMDRGLPVVLSQQHRWMSRATEKRIEEAWDQGGPVRSARSVKRSASRTVLYDYM